MHMLKLTQIGNSVGVVLPKEALARLKLGKGESVFLTEGQGPGVTKGRSTCPTVSVPSGIRTRVTALKGLGPGPD